VNNSTPIICLSTVFMTWVMGKRSTESLEKIARLMFTFWNTDGSLLWENLNWFTPERRNICVSFHKNIYKYKIQVRENRR
jgi:hypothetical protein